MGDPLLKEIISIVAEQLAVQRSSINLRTAAEDVSAWDSLRHLSIITAIETRFDIELSMDTIAAITNVETLYRAVADAIATLEAPRKNLGT